MDHFSGKKDPFNIQYGWFTYGRREIRLCFIFIFYGEPGMDYLNFEQEYTGSEDRKMMVVNERYQIKGGNGDDKKKRDDF